MWFPQTSEQLNRLERFVQHRLTKHDLSLASPAEQHKHLGTIPDAAWREFSFRRDTRIHSASVSMSAGMDGLLAGASPAVAPGDVRVRLEDAAPQPRVVMSSATPNQTADQGPTAAVTRRDVTGSEEDNDEAFLFWSMCSLDTDFRMTSPDLLPFPCWTTKDPLDVYIAADSKIMQV